MSRYFLPKAKLEDLLQNVGVVLSGDTHKEIIAYCPFHNNRDTPAFNMSLKPPHKWKCHNGKCAKKGNIISLLTMKGYSRNEAEKIVVKGSYEVSDLMELVEELMGLNEDGNSSTDWNSVNPDKFRKYDAEEGYPARLYLQSRGVCEEAYDFFGIGYAPPKRMLVIPVFDERHCLQGVIGREIETKRYQYSTGLGRGKIVWNLDNAKVYDSIILTEGALDAVYIWQAGYENVGAVLGSVISPPQWQQIKKHFTEIICFFDNDDAGKGLTESLLESVLDVSVSVVTYPDRLVTYIDQSGEEKERPIKDPGELTTSEIQDMVERRKSGIELLLA